MPMNAAPEYPAAEHHASAPTALRRTVLIVAAINAAYFAVEVVVALAIGSVALLADRCRTSSEDTAVNLPHRARARLVARRAGAGRAGGWPWIHRLPHREAE